MQQPSYTPANAQHVPPGWSFPTLAVQQQPMQPPAALPAQPVRGGGAAAGTVTRVRWGRLLPLFAGVLLLGFGIWSVTQDSSPAPRSGGEVSGGGGSEDIDIARSARSVSGGGGSDTTEDLESAPSSAADDAPATTPPSAAAARTTPGRTTPARTTTPSRTTSHRPVRRPHRRAGAAGAGAAAGTRAGSSIAATTATAPRRVSGGGAGPSGELPYTGLETWLAAILGVLLLGLGICVQVNAVRIAATAMLYRRGILLRPVECARLVQEAGGMARVRVLLSNVLHKLLEEPAGNDFVGTRLAR